MSTQAQVRAAWKAAVFDDAAVQAISDAAYDYDYTERTQKERGLLRTGQQVNFFTYLVTRTPREQATGGLNYLYEVEVNYYRAKYRDGINYSAVNDVFETITDRVIAGLDYHWSNTVDFSRLPENQPEITDLEVAGQDCWRVSQIYTARKFILI